MKKFCLFVFMCIAFISCNKNLPPNENEISAPDDPEAFFDDQKIEKRPVDYPPLSEYFFNEQENCYIINNVIPKSEAAKDLQAPSAPLGTAAGAAYSEYDTGG